MNGHDITEQTRLLSHQHYAVVIDRDPELIGRAASLLAEHISAHGGTGGQRLSALILGRPWDEARKRMLGDGAEGRLLRSNSPFSTLIGIPDPKERKRLWRQARRDLMDRMSSSEQSAA